MKLFKRLKNKKGQSLAEFAVTTAMMATLATTAAPKFSGVGEGAKEKKTMNSIDKVLKAANNFYNEKVSTEGRGRFPGQLKYNESVPDGGGYLDQTACLSSLDLFETYESSEASNWGSVFGTQTGKAIVPTGSNVNTSEDPDSDAEDQKVSILNNLNFNSSYNIAADSLRWSPVSFSAGTRLFKDKLSVNLNGSFDPYKVIASSNGSPLRINEFNDNFLGLRLTNASLTANYSISSADFKKDKKGDKKKENTDPNNSQDLIGADINPTDRFGKRNNTTNTSEEDKNKTAKLIRVPKFSEVPYPVIMEPSLVIEYYSR